MGTWATAKRSEINKTFEAGSGDMVGDTEPVSIWKRAGSPQNATITGTITRVNGVLRFSSTVHGETLDLADVQRLFAIAYLDVLTGNHDQATSKSLVIADAESGNEIVSHYPDPE